MLKKLIILTLTVWCLSGISSLLLAQDGNPEVFGKKSTQPVVEDEEEVQEDQSSTLPDREEPGSLTPQKGNKVMDNRIAPQKAVGKPDSVQSNTKEKESKSKYNILLYYFYKSKHEETEEKENASDRDS